MRSLFLLCLLSCNLLGQAQFLGDVQYNIVIRSDQQNDFDVLYEVRFPELNDKPEAVYFTESQDSFLLMMFEDLKNAHPERSQLLLHFHGMWGSRPGNFNRAYKLLSEHFLERPESDIHRMINVKWPGNKVEYHLNKEKILEIADPLQDIVVKLSRKIQLINFLNNKVSIELDVISHSLGNVLIEEMVQYIEPEEFEYPLFSEVVLAAPDQETDAFIEGGRMSKFHKLSKRTHVYFSTKDLTLGISKNLNERSRLGLDGPITESLIQDNVYFVDCTQVTDEANFGDKMTGHSYYRASPIATFDMLECFKSKRVEEIGTRKLTNKQLQIFQIQFEQSN